MQLVAVEKALEALQPGQMVFVHSAAMTPTYLISAVVDSEVRDISFIHIHTEGDADYVLDENKDRFHTHACFVGANIRKQINANGNANYIPVFLSEIHQVLKHGNKKPDVALIKVSPPDAHGFCSLGVSVDVTLPALKSAKTVIAEISEHVPRVHGDGFIHVSDIDFGVESHREMYCLEPKELSPEEIQIGKNVADLVEDGSTLQMGIGGVPDAVLRALSGHKDLGIHTEMFSDGILPLVQSGVVNGFNKKIYPGKLVSAFSVGSQKLYDFLHDNPIVEFKEAAFTNDTAVIRKNPKVVAINSAIELDLTGQVCADSIGTYQFSGVGGQMDFIRGAALSEGGKPIIALSSTTRKGESKLAPFLKQGASVTTTRAHVHWIVTEYGAVDLFGQDLVQRAKLLTSIAHPGHREVLERATYERYRI
ncbi:MAG: acetyl-CoA hydrolase/transferase family protein [Cyclobacteriaceae bacterium]|nr:acetyl-CoA hydrolase/transferase family protein [Cyclobacteriaceae bacterium HetDA_MAG_MS6]